MNDICPKEGETSQQGIWSSHESRIGKWLKAVEIVCPQRALLLYLLTFEVIEMRAVAGNYDPASAVERIEVRANRNLAPFVERALMVGDFPRLRGEGNDDDDEEN